MPMSSWPEQNKILILLFASFLFVLVFSLLLFVCFEFFFNVLRDIGEADHKFGWVEIQGNLRGVGEGKGYDQNTMYVKKVKKQIKNYLLFFFNSGTLQFYSSF